MAQDDSCVGQEYVVDCGVIGGDGSEDAPFGSLSDALAAAADSGACGVVIHLDWGHCEENLSIDLPTTIIGEGLDSWIEGTITNTSGAFLELQTLRITGGGEVGVLVVDHPDAETVLTAVAIENGEQYGVFQSGGQLTVDTLFISATRAPGFNVIIDLPPGQLQDPPGRSEYFLHGLDARPLNRGYVNRPDPTEPVFLDPPAGALFLAGGVTAILHDVVAFDNRVAGLVVTAPDTWAYVNGLHVTGTLQATDNGTFMEAADAPPGRAAAVEVRHGATFGAFDAEVLDNEQIGVLVANDARALLVLAEVSDTRFRHTLSDNIVVVGATLQMSQFELRGAPRAGLSMSNAYLTGSNGIIADNAWGIGVDAVPEVPEDYDWLACLDDVTIGPNELQNIAATSGLYVPGPPQPTCPPNQECPPPPDPVCMEVAIY